MNVRTLAPKSMPRPMGNDGHLLLDTIWLFFIGNRRWPTFDDVDRKLYAAGLDFEDAVQQLCPALLRGVSTNPHMVPRAADPLQLTIAGAANCSGTSGAIKLFLHMVRTAALMEAHFRPSQPGEQPVLRPVDLRPAPDWDPSLQTKESMFAAAALAQNEPPFRGGSINPEDLGWSLNFDRTIRPFTAVGRLEDYWQQREQVEGPVNTEAAKRPFPSRRTDFVTAPMPAAVAAPPATVAAPTKPQESMSVTCVFHPLIAKVAAERFDTGFYRDAVSRAFQAVEHRVQELADCDQTGVSLMGFAFNTNSGPPKLTVTRSTGSNLGGEQTGMQFLFKGAAGALRNPRMHGPDEKDDRDEAAEMLAFASFLMRRLDIEDDKRKAAALES
ncbi:TIGR02391 family protein [Streptomyces sp. NPDC046860]|uniref:TIGR02391 family protein n=1 Tax=Streptomyces sp. NPDC046860 TaxID=3154495 RepID=UPI00340B7E4A